MYPILVVDVVNCLRISVSYPHVN